MIDDEPDVLLLCRVNLEFEGHRVIVASEGAQGLELALAERPDVIVLDMMMPENDGLTVLRGLQAAPETRDIPVVFLTAKSQGHDQVRALLAGAADYLVKPFSPSALTEALRRVAALSPAGRAARRSQLLARLKLLNRL